MVSQGCWFRKEENADAGATPQPCTEGPHLHPVDMISIRDPRKGISLLHDKPALNVVSIS